LLQNYKVQVEAETTSYIFPNPEFPIVWIDVPNGEEYHSERSLTNNEEAILTLKVPAFNLIFFKE